jgi:Fuc2NAc and GlcNAc transferase
MILASPLFAALLSFSACWLWLVAARRSGLLDRPNARSAHAVPTPHGGGLGVLLGIAGGMLLAVGYGLAWPALYWQLLLLLSLLGAVGLLDDLRGLRVGVRLAAYTLVCVCAAYLLSRVGVYPGLLLLGLVVIYLLWMLNLFNFMDGSDGFAASEALFACVAAGALSLAGGAAVVYPLTCLLAAGACLGFLAWNRPPARLFMGDAGSIPLGFLLAMLSLMGASQGGVSPVTWLILLAVFIVDASYTLLWRVITGQPFTEAHSLHLYQRLRRRWNSHGRVLGLLWAVNLLWLLPLALAAARWPRHEMVLLLLAYGPLLLAMTRAVKIP